MGKSKNTWGQVGIWVLFSCSLSACDNEASPDESILDAAINVDGAVSLMDQTLAGPDAQVMVDVAQPTPDADIEVADAATETDAAVQPADAEIELDSVIAGTDSASADAADLPDADPPMDEGNTMSVPGCRVGDAWTVSIRAIPPAGMGCRQDGNSSQGDVTHRLVVENPDGGPNSISGFVVRPDQTVRAFSETGADSVTLTATLSEEGNTCVLIGRASLGVNFPPDGSCDNRPTEVRMSYEYNLRATDGVVIGTGFVVSEYGAFPIEGNTDPATVEPCRAPCREPLDLTGDILVP